MALIIAVIQIFQVKRIKELSDVVDRLQKQNELIEKQFRLQHTLALYEKAPFFRFYNTSYTPTPREFKFQIMNEGQDAFKFSLENPSNYFSVRLDNIPVSCRRQCNIDITINYEEPLQASLGFWLHYEGVNGISFRQFLVYDHAKCNVLVDNPEVTFAPKAFAGV